MDTLEGSDIHWNGGMGKMNLWKEYEENINTEYGGTGRMAFSLALALVDKWEYEVPLTRWEGD
jgi:hypothetical protein